jgi:hypothetical protein
MPTESMTDGSKPVTPKARAQQRWREKQKQQRIQTITVRVPAVAAEIVKAFAARLRDGAALAEILPAVAAAGDQPKPPAPHQPKPRRDGRLRATTGGRRRPSLCRPGAAINGNGRCAAAHSAHCAKCTITMRPTAGRPDRPALPTVPEPAKSAPRRPRRR